MLSTLKYYHENIYKDPIEITNVELLCVKIAGLCHDLGHGPFSHLFDGEFIPKSSNRLSGWTHEHGSCALFNHLIQENKKVRKLMKENGIGQVEQDMIKSMIMGVSKDEIKKTDYHGQMYKKQFLYEIVSNKATGIDCDKFDYFARDTHHVGIKNSFEFKRYFKNIRIMPINGNLQICARDKEESNLYELFHIRWTLHRQVYQHKTSQIIEAMLTEALLLADDKFKISASIHNMERFTEMTNSIFYEILKSKSTKPEVVKAKKILQNIQTRELYPFCGEYNLPDSDKEDSDKKEDSEEIVKEIVEAIVQYCKEKKMEIEKDDVCVLKAKFNFGKGKDNPLKNMHFFGKDGKPKDQQEYNGLKPSHFEMKILRVYSKDRGKKSELVKEAFEMWKKQNYHKQYVRSKTIGICFFAAFCFVGVLAYKQNCS